ncbi:protein ALTERED PHOSPHATE STARVATION RESPONSE 1-like [Euphorbia lathyris]|uniref:protein ALTERED PHOSPHATE STARVATION RESPONSE 1-like n=1 Tax=Euphorbia lathyris TaxID=212925 RepID=UPI003313315B
MGCGLSKQEEEDDVLSLCRERKRFLKLGLERRYAFADAQFKYNQSLYALAMALRLFVVRHSSPSSPFLITYPDSQNETPKKCLKLEDNVKEEEEKSGEDEDEEICDHFYDDDEVISSPNMGIGWDFFYPFDEIRVGDDLKAVREKEGIPELEENVDNKVVEKNEVKVIETETETPAKGRELLEALKEIEEHFLRAYDSGLDISKMLEVNRVHLHSGLDEIKETSNKVIRSITWNRSASFRSSSSSRSLLSCSSTNSSKWNEFRADVFDEFGMEAGSHSLTLGRLYAWEKKLYVEVKAGEETRKIYERKCSRLRKSDTNRDRFSAEVKELHSRMLVAIRSVESISNRIEKLRDEELQPQFLELLHRLMTNWKIMLESHETQNRIMLEVKHFNSPSYGKFSNDSHRLATLELEAELDNWRTCFDAYVSTQKSYIEALCGWLSKFIPPEVEFYSGGKSSPPPLRIRGPPLLATCQAWLAWLDKLPDSAVTYAMKSFGKDIRAMWSQQGKEQQQKRKVDGLARELEKRNLAFQRAERRVLESKISEHESQASIRNRVEYLTEGKRLLDVFKMRLDEEKEKHIFSMHKTQQITISGFQTGFSSVFESLAEFSESSVKMYADLVTYSSNATTADENDTDLSYIDMIN